MERNINLNRFGNYSIAIDGPAASGKSTVAKKIAADLGIIYIDTGAMYRAIALYCIRNNIQPNDAETVNSVLDDIDVTIKLEDGNAVVFLNGENVKGLIRTEEVSAGASTVSANPKVREKLVSLQQKLGESESVIMDGRDIGSVVLPKANLKIYMTADINVRAQRRYDELVENSRADGTNYDNVLADLTTRDYNDSHRAASPLVRLPEAKYIDTTEMSIDEVVDTVLNLIESDITS